MERPRFKPTWPFLCVLIGLFILSAASPRAWRQVVKARQIVPGSTSAAPASHSATPPEAQTDDWAGIVPLELVGHLPIAVSDADGTVRSEPTPNEAVRPIGRFETIEPAPKLARCAAEVQVDLLEQIAPVLPSRGSSASQRSEQSIDSVWLPVPSLVGLMPLAGGAAFDPTVLPVRRPDGLQTTNYGEAMASDWPEPIALLEMLDELAWECEAGLWAREVARRVTALGQAVAEQSPATESILSELYDLGAEAGGLAAQSSDRRMATRVLRAEHALGRRLDLWLRLIVPGQSLLEGWHVADGESSGRVDATELLRRLERYESTGLNHDAEPVAEVCRRLAQSPAADHQEFNRTLQTHYRNANLRVAVAEILLNRLIPDRQPEREQVHDTVLGRPVHGHSTTESDVTVRLIPDPKRLRLALEVRGEVYSQTTSTSGPATFRSDGASAYVARKEMELGTWGIRAWPAKVAVNHDMWLRSFQTSLDGIPLVGALAHDVARNQLERKSPQAEREVERKVASRVKRRFDEELKESIEKLSDTIEEWILQPMARMSLEPVTISAETTDRRMVTRLRLADDDQLGSSTPRPQAPGDSLLSVQIHQSALNNVLEQLELDGHTFTLGELRRHVADKLNHPAMAEKTTEQDDVEITFAASDAMHVAFGEGRVTLTLSVVRLSRSPRRWSDFQVRVSYRPEVEGRTARLVRDGVVQLIGRMNMRSQIALRGIFSKTFHKERPWVVTPERLETDPAFDPMAITQLVIDDGWLGFALGPKRPEPRTAAVQSTVR